MDQMENNCQEDLDRRHCCWYPQQESCSVGFSLLLYHKKLAGAVCRLQKDMLKIACMETCLMLSQIEVSLKVACIAVTKRLICD